MNKLNVKLCLEGLRGILTNSRYSRNEIIESIVDISNLTKDENIRIKLGEMIMLETDKEIADAITALIFEIEN